MKLFLLSLSMLFGASLVGYMVIRHAAASKGTLPYGTLQMPRALWFSTAAMMASGLTIQSALRAVRQGRQKAFRSAIVATAILAIAFLAIQVPSLFRLLHMHGEASRSQNVFLYGLVLMLIGLHASHVIGGLAPLIMVTARAIGGRYSSAQHGGVQYCATYWHFLDVVWLIMFGVLWLTG